jgi:recombination protein RecT
MNTPMADNLAERVNAAANQTGEQPGTDLERRHTTMAGQIQRMQAQFQAAMPTGGEAVQLIRDAVTALRTQRHLAECDELSVLGGLMTFAQLGLRPHVPALGHGWLIPFWDKNIRGFRAQTVIGYKGFVDLAHRTGRIASLVGRIVHEHDVFGLDYGLDTPMTHRPKMDGDRGPAVGYYTRAAYTNGGADMFYMSRWEAEQHRDRYAMARTRQGAIVGPWRDNFDAMATKTTFLQLARWMPKSTELDAAIAADEAVRSDLSSDSLDALFHAERPDTTPDQTDDQPDPAGDSATEGKQEGDPR